MAGYIPTLSSEQSVPQPPPNTLMLPEPVPQLRIWPRPMLLTLYSATQSLHRFAKFTRSLRPFCLCHLVRHISS